MQLERPIAIVGLKHVGKSTVGRIVAEHFGCRFLDVDVEMIHRARDEGWFSTTGDPKTPAIRQLYRFLGAEAFLSWELSTLRSFFESNDARVTERSVIATGGGICNSPLAIDLLHLHCTTVYLKDDPELLYARIEARGVPAYLDPARPREHFIEVAATRSELYSQIADHTIPVTGVEPRAVKDLIINAVR